MTHNWILDKHGKPDEWAWESGFHNGVICLDCGFSPCVHCTTDWFDLDDCPGPKVKKPQTNGDRIRAMTDEELAEVIKDGISSDVCDYCKHNDLHCDGSPCKNKADAEIITEWLQQPAKED